MLEVEDNGLTMMGIALEEGCARRWGCRVGKRHRLASTIRCRRSGRKCTVAGPKEDAEKVQGTMKEWRDVEVRTILEREAHYDKDIVVLGKVVRWRHGGLGLEADERRRRLIMEQMGIVPGCNGVVSPAGPAGGRRGRGR